MVMSVVSAFHIVPRLPAAVMPTRTKTHLCIKAMADDDAKAAAAKPKPPAKDKSDAPAPEPAEVTLAKKEEAAKKKAEEEAAAAAEAEAKAKEEAEAAAKKEAEAKKKAEAAAKKKAEEEAKAKAQTEEAVKCFSQKGLVLVSTANLNPQPATVNERADYLRAEGLDEKNIQAAMAECGVTEVEYKRDAWGRIVALNDVKYNPNPVPPKSDGFGQNRLRTDIVR